MANIKSAAKRARQAIVRRDRNQATKKSIRSIEKKVRQAVAAKDKAKAEELLSDYSSKMGKATNKNMFHKNTMARKIARLTQFMNKTLAK